ncbi:MAG: hypothetical protein VKK97_11785 [Synechococcaceae cyanobacterium]|nr:hypothetical protein [Synechococcaceae cyanobacterium]
MTAREFCRWRRALLLLLVVVGSFQAGRIAEREAWPCRLRPLLSPLAPLLPQQLPDKGLCELLLWLPG